MSAVAYLDLHIENAESFEAEINLSKINSKTFVSINKNAFDFKGEVRKHHYSKNAVASFNTKISDQNVIISLTNEQTKEIKPGRYIYDFFVKDKREHLNKFSALFDTQNYLTTTIDFPETYTIEFWMFPNKLIGDIFKIGTDTSSKKVYFEDELFKISDIADSQNIKLNEWTHIAIVFSAQIKLYINNKEFLNTEYNSKTGEQLIRIGEGFNGYISNFRILSEGKSSFILNIPLQRTATTALLTCNNEFFEDSKIINNNVKSDEKSPFERGIFYYKLIEGNIMVYQTATKY